MTSTLSTSQLFQLKGEQLRAIVIHVILLIIAVLGLIRSIYPKPGQEPIDFVILVLVTLFFIFEPF